MESFCHPHKPIKQQIIDLLFAFLVMIISFAVAVPLHAFIVKAGPLIQESTDVAGEMSLPTVGRLVYLIVSFIFGIGFIILGNYLNKKDKDLFGFGCAFLGGVFLWQSIGECFWHFKIGNIQIVRIESSQSLPLVIIFVILLIVFGLFMNKNFSMWIATLSFACNWLGHFITMGTYPMVSNAIEWKLWSYIISGIFGSLSIITGLVLSLFCCKNKKGIYYSSMLIFIGVGIIYFGFTEV